jgi:hypothetical protein
VNKTLVFAALVLAAASMSAQSANSDNGGNFKFKNNSLVVSRNVYTGTAATVTIGQTLPPGCVAGSVKVPLLAGGTASVKVKCAAATNDGTYPTVFNNANADGNFGVSSQILLDNITTDGKQLGTFAVPADLLVTSFSSKSEMALHLSADGKSLAFSGYRGGPGFATGINLIDVSNSNTPGVIDPTNPDVAQYFRTVAEVDSRGNVQITEGNFFSGDNGRGAIKGGNGLYYVTGNSNNGGLSTAQLTTTQVGLNLISSTGIGLLIPGQPAPVPPNVAKIGDFEITQAGYPKADKPGKDNNFRGLAIFNNTLFVTKGSGSNGINTVYQVGDSGVLPSGSAADLATVPITILPGFPTSLASGVDQNGNAAPVMFPFGIWFADANTLYVCDEGDGTLVSPAVNGNVASASAQATAGIQKWMRTNGTWQLAYTLQNGLNIGVPYSVPNYPAALNPATDGCRNITGQVNGDGTADIFAITSTVSNNADIGADPNKLVKVTDLLRSTTLPTSTENHNGNAPLGTFVTLRAAQSGEVLRGVAFAPHAEDDDQ